MRYARLVILPALVATLLIGACQTSRPAAAPDRSAWCAPDAVAAYRNASGGDYRCALALLPYLEREATRHEVHAYILLRTGHVEEAVDALSDALSALEEEENARFSVRARQARTRLETRRALLLQALEVHVNPAEPSDRAETPYLINE